MKIKSIKISEYKILKDVHIEFSPDNNSPYVLIGENGKGKSTLVQLIYALLKFINPKNTDDDKIQNVFRNISLEHERTSLCEIELILDGEVKKIKYTVVKKVDKTVRDVYLYLLDKKNVTNGVILDDKWLDLEEAKKLKIKSPQLEEEIKRAEIANEKLKRIEFTYFKDIDEHSEKIEYRINPNYILTIQSDCTLDEIEKITSKIFLVSPGSQNAIFEDDFWNFYIENQSHYKYENMGVLSKEFIKRAFARDNAQKANEGKFGKHYDTVLRELENLIIGIKINLDANNEENPVSFFKDNVSRQLSTSDLSHGELRKLSLYTWIKSKVGDEPIFLIDEVDIGLHPKWQKEIANELEKWSENSQILLTTHSPYIFQALNHENIIKFSSCDSFVTPEIVQDAPIGRDINSLLVSLMDAEVELEEMTNLEDNYIELLEARKKDTDEAKKILSKILELEGKNSKFLQKVKLLEGMIK